MKGATFFAAVALMAAQPAAALQGAEATFTPTIEAPFPQVLARMRAQKPAIERRQRALLESRYDLRDRRDRATMSRGKPLQAGVRVKLADGMTCPTTSCPSSPPRSTSRRVRTSATSRRGAS